MSLVDKIKAARLSKVVAGGLTFIVRRPTDLEWYELAGSVDARRLLTFVDDWEGVKEADLINGGDPHPVKFDRALFLAWVEDQPEIMSAVVKGVHDAYVSRIESQADRAKN